MRFSVVANLNPILCGTRSNNVSFRGRFHLKVSVSGNLVHLTHTSSVRRMTHSTRSCRSPFELDGMIRLPQLQVGLDSRFTTIIVQTLDSGTKRQDQTEMSTSAGPSQGSAQVIDLSESSPSPPIAGTSSRPPLATSESDIVFVGENPRTLALPRPSTSGNSIARDILGTSQHCRSLDNT